MSDGDGPMINREGIHIEREIADSVSIEEELDSNVVGPYQFPQPTRRRTSGWVLLAGAAVTALVVDGGWVSAIGLAALAIWNFASAWPLSVDEHQALAVAGSAVPFPVGHASAAVTFKGMRSRPRWSVVVYSAEEPPDRRALVVVDAISGEVAEEPYVEDVPLSSSGT
jgi:hypothetical protein